MHDLDLVEMATELLEIHKQFQHYSNMRISDFELETFTQWWGNTSGGFEGIGGSAMTEQRTYVFIPKKIDEQCLVFFSSRFAYKVYLNELFIKDLKEKNVAGLKSKQKYEK